MIRIYHEEVDGVWFAAGVEDEKVYATSFSMSEREVLQRLLKALPYNVPFRTEKKTCHISSELLKTLKAIFDGRDVSFSFQMAMDHLPNYTRNVLKCISSIPVGYLTTYNAVSKIAGGSPRAVGRATASNPFMLLIPCHRVVRANFSIGGYALGEEMKLGLLQRENRGYEESARLSVNGKVLPLFPVKKLEKVRIARSSSCVRHAT